MQVCFLQGRTHYIFQPVSYSLELAPGLHCELLLIGAADSARKHIEDDLGKLVIDHLRTFLIISIILLCPSDRPRSLACSLFSLSKESKA